jgi:flagellar motor switch protein FliN
MNAQLESPPAGFDVLLDVPVTLSVELGSCRLPMRDVLQLSADSIVPLNKPAGAPVDLYVNQKLIGRGEVVVVDNHFGIKIAEIIRA